MRKRTRPITAVLVKYARTSTAEQIAALLPRGGDRGDRFLLASASDLTDREELEEKLRQAQKMEAIDQLTGGVACASAAVDRSLISRHSSSAITARICNSIVEAALNARGVATPRQGAWTATAVRRTLARVQTLA